MAIKPTKPNWIPDDSTGIIVPGGSKQTAGWFKEERPPYQFHNWFWNIVSQFIDYFSGEAEYNVIIDSDTDEGDYATLAAYILAGSTPGDRVFLKVDEEITGATMVIPANILLKVEKGKKLWCDEDRSVLQFSDGVVTEGDLLLELSHTGTVPTAVSFNGDDNNHSNIIVKNTSTGTITAAFKIEAAKEGNAVKGEILNPSGTVTTPLVNSAVGINSNDVMIRLSGGEIWGIRRPRTATKNKSDSPAPDDYNGGTIWVELRTTGTTGVVIDDSIDWRDRFITWCGHANEVATSALPGQAGDNVLRGYTNAESPSAGGVVEELSVGFLYTEAGSADGSVAPFGYVYQENYSTRVIHIYARSSDGKLVLNTVTSAPPDEIDVILRIDYSPKQNHY